jgi:TPR repeat protein
MSKNSLVKLTQKQWHQHVKHIIICIVLVALSSSYQTCVTEVIRQPQEENLVMNVVSRKDKEIEVYIALGPRVKEVILANYKLSVDIISTKERGEEGFISYMNRLGHCEQGSHIQQPLSYFTAEERIGAENKKLPILFMFDPAVGAVRSEIHFKLFNESEIAIGAATVIWENTGEKQLMLSSNEPSISAVLTASAKSKCTKDIDESKPAETEQGIIETLYPNNYIKLKESASHEKSKIKLVRGSLAVPTEYVSMSQEELAERANGNDLHAQELIVTRIITEGPWPSLLKLVNLCHWRGIEEKIQHDGRYAHLLLVNPKKIKNTSIYQLFIDNIMKQAQAGDALAQTNLGIMYLTGKGTPKNINQAITWFIRAAEKNFGMAYYMLGQIYSHGDKPLSNIKEAIEWYTKAANQGIEHSNYNLEKLYIYRILIDKSEKGEELTDEKKIEYKTGIEFLARQADKVGDKDAQAALGLIYCAGKGVEQNARLGLEWVNMAINYEKKILPTNNHLIKKIGSLYYYGKFGIPVDYQIAFTHYMQAAKNRFTPAQKHLAKMYFKGKGIKQNFGQATFWALQAKEQSWLVNQLKDMLNDTLNSSQVGEAFQSLAKNMLVLCKSMRSIEKYAVLKGNPYTLPNLFQGLEEIVLEFAKWWQQLEHQPGLLVDCVSLGNMDILLKYQADTNELTYIKEHVYQQNKYISLGKENVQFASQLFEEQTYQAHYSEALYLLNRITSVYKKVQEGLSIEALEIKKEIKRLHTNEKEKEQELLKDFHSKVIVVNLLNAKLNLLEIVEKNFIHFYKLLFQKIEEEVLVRNNRFKEEHSYNFQLTSEGT